MLPRCIWAKGNYWSISALQSSTYLSRGYENEPAGLFVSIQTPDEIALQQLSRKRKEIHHRKPETPWILGRKTHREWDSARKNNLPLPSLRGSLTEIGLLAQTLWNKMCMNELEKRRGGVRGGPEEIGGHRRKNNEDHCQDFRSPCESGL